MTQKPQIGKTIYMREVLRVFYAMRGMERVLRGLGDECGARYGVVSMLVSQAAVALTDNLDALHELERIVKEAGPTGD